MWGFEASALAFIQFPGTLASTRELIAEAWGYLDKSSASCSASHGPRES